MKRFLLIILLSFTMIVSAQQTEIVDFNRASYTLTFEPDNGLVKGVAVMFFDVLKETDSIFIDAKNMRFDHVTLSRSQITFKNDQERLWVYSDFKPSKNNKLLFNFEATPKKALYFLGWDNEAPDQIWTQGQGKYTSNWLPSIDDMNDKLEFDLTVVFDENYDVIANGRLTSKRKNGSNHIWTYDMKQPMSSYLVALAIGKYHKKTEVSKSGTPLEMYYYPKDSTQFEPTYRYTKRMFDFLEDEIGVPYPWQNYKQVPVHDFLYAGMENTSLTIFADTFVTDSIGFADRNYVNINAHELAHQWFGDLVTETSGTHHWLQEGFATYYALLVEREFFGDDYFYWQLHRSAEQLKAQDLDGKSTALLDPKSSSLTFYQKGAWTLVMLRELLGDRVFKDVISTYLDQHRFQNVSTEDLLSLIEKIGDLDMTQFADKWLRSKEFPYNDALEYLKSKSTFIHEYEMADCEVLNSKCYDYLNSGLSDEAKVKIISQQPSLIDREAFKNSVKVRQAIAQHLTKIPQTLKDDYESLLDDRSYATKEAALYHLWTNFPEDRVTYLEKTKGIDGFSDRNVRMLWLTLGLVTPEYRLNDKKDMYNELIDYTSNTYGYDIREQAFTYLTGINACNNECQENLKDASQHHNWRLQKFARSLLNKNQ